jgi:hypothetical protein
MNNSILTGKNVSPLKQNMEDGQFSLMRKIWRNTRDTHINEVGVTVNYTYQDSSSYTERKKARALGKKSYNSPLSYTSYDPVGTYHTKRRVISAGTVSPKKKGFTRV